MTLRQQSETISVPSRGRGLVDISGQLRAFVAASGMRNGLLTIFCRHTSASLLVQENADPDVRRDLDDHFTRMVPDGQPQWRHNSEGPDDMSAHIRTALTQSSLAIPLNDGQLALGVWQGVFLWEHRTRAHQRQLVLHLLGE